MTAPLEVFVYGAGRVGRSLALAWASAEDVAVLGAWNRGFRGAMLTSQQLAGVPSSSGDVLPEQLPKAAVIVASVVDDQLEQIAARLAPHLRADQVLLHTSGALSGAVLAVPGMKAQLGSLHPLQSLARPEGDPALLRGACFAVEGTPAAMEAATRLALAAGGEPVPLRDAKAKVLYHAAAVMAANYLTVLVDAAATLHGHAGIDARTSARMLAPLLRGTLEQLLVSVEASEEGDGRAAIARSLTGPARRGDEGTIAGHLKAIERLAKRDADAADLPALYRALLHRAEAMAARASTP